MGFNTKKIETAALVLKLNIGTARNTKSALKNTLKVLGAKICSCSTADIFLTTLEHLKFAYLGTFMVESIHRFVFLRKFLLLSQMSQIVYKFNLDEHRNAKSALRNALEALGKKLFFWGGSWDV